MKIRGNTVGTTMPRTNWNQTDPTKADYLKGKEDLQKLIDDAHTAADDAQTAADDAQTAADHAQTAADHAQTAADNAQTAADNAQTAADNAQTTADNAQTAADNAQTTADGKVGKTEVSVTLAAGSWVDNQQTVAVSGVTKNNTVIVSPASSSHVAYCEAVVRHSGQGSGTITFACEDVPEEDIVVNVLILDETGTGSGGSTGTGGSGEDGFSPIATVKQTDTGADISITDKNGTTTATITNGKDGDPGAKGESGVYILSDGETLDDVPAEYDVVIDPNGSPDASGGGINVTGATVGQTVKISAVDENGVPTAWEPMDFPSGGGGSAKWKLIEHFTVEAETLNYTIPLQEGAEEYGIYWKYTGGTVPQRSICVDSSLAQYGVMYRSSVNNEEFIRVYKGPNSVLAISQNVSYSASRVTNGGTYTGSGAEFPAMRLTTNIAPDTQEIWVYWR